MGSCLSVNIQRLDPISMRVERKENTFIADISLKGSPLYVRSSLVCTTDKVNWYPLYSVDGFALVDKDGVILLSK